MSIDTENLGLTKRFLNATFQGQLNSIYRSRLEKVQRLVDWFDYLESNLTQFKQNFQNLEEEEKRRFYNLQMVYEGLKERTFKGVDGDFEGEVEATSVLNAFEVLSDLTKCVAQKHANGAMIVGPGGIGKTWEILETLKSLNLTEGRGFVKITGTSTPLAMYNLLYKNKDRLVVFDDCDGIFKDVSGINILKSVLDTLPKRLVSWNSTGSKPIVPEFEFRGQVIFISNLQREDFRKNLHFRALLTRVLTVVISATPEEVLSLCIKKLPLIAVSLTEEQRKELLDFLEENYTNIKDLSLRYVKHLVSLRKSTPNWRKVALVLS